MTTVFVANLKIDVLSHNLTVSLLSFVLVRARFFTEKSARDLSTHQVGDGEAFRPNKKGGKFQMENAVLHKYKICLLNKWFLSKKINE